MLNRLKLAASLALLALPAAAQLPKRDLIVEFRHVEEGAERSAGYTVNTQARNAWLLAQQVQVRNGEKASLRLEQSIPVQWVKEAATQDTSFPAAGGAAHSRSAGVTQAVTWLTSGQSISVQPRWPGAKQAVSVEIEVKSSSVAERIGAELPAQSSSQLVTTVSASLGQWVTIASTGSSPQRGVYGNDAASEMPRLFQIRVLAP